MRTLISKFVAMICASWRSIIAILLASYGVVDSFVEIQFIHTLRNAERDVASKDDEDAWGYGQVLAVLIWVPILVEYFHGLLRGSEEGKYASSASKAKKEAGEKQLGSPATTPGQLSGS